MKSLQAFWHWLDNEKPAELTANSFAHLSDLADQALDAASDMVAERIGSPYRGVASMRDYWPAIRDLSLTLCEAIGKMHEAVPEGACEDVPGLRNVAIDECADKGDVPWFKREIQTEPVVKPRPLDLATAPLRAYHKQVASTYDPETHELNVYTCIDVEGCDRLRGLSPKTIIVNGAAHMFAPGVLSYLYQVIAPMKVDGARIRRWPE